MGLFKSILDKVQGKTEELQKKAATRAAEKAAEVAIKQGGKAARAAVESAGKRLEQALFGDASPDSEHDDPEEEARAGAKPDPFAKLKAAEEAKKAAEHAKKERDREEKRLAKERAAKAAKLEADVDAELAALKKKVQK